MTGDQDTMQLVSPNVRVLYQRPGGSNTLFDESAVSKKYGLLPKQIPDLKALMGDSSDNIPGVPGIDRIQGGRAFPLPVRETPVRDRT